MSEYINIKITQCVSEFENHKLTREQALQLLVCIGESELSAAARFTSIYNTNVQCLPWLLSLIGTLLTHESHSVQLAAIKYLDLAKHIASRVLDCDYVYVLKMPTDRIKCRMQGTVHPQIAYSMETATQLINYLIDGACLGFATQQSVALYD